MNRWGVAGIVIAVVLVIAGGIAGGIYAGVVIIPRNEAIQKDWTDFKEKFKKSYESTDVEDQM